MTDRGPLSIGEARAKSAKHSEAQENAERFRVQAARDLAEKERAYRSELAQEIVRQHADGVAWSTASDVARGQKRVADLRYDRDVARGVLDAAAEAAYRHAADRRAFESVVRWSQGLDLGRIPESEPEQPVVFGARRAA